MFGHRDERPAAHRALEAARVLKPGSWESVEALSLLAIEFAGRPEATEMLGGARQAAASLKSGSWDRIRALAWLAQAERALAAR